MPVMASAAALVDDHPIDDFVSMVAGVIDCDRMAGAKRVIINRTAAIVEKLHVATVTKSALLITDAEADVV